MSKITQKRSVVNSTPLTELIVLLPGWLLPQMPKTQHNLDLEFSCFSNVKTVSHGGVDSTWEYGNRLVILEENCVKSWASNSWYSLSYAQNTEVEIFWVFLLMVGIASKCDNSRITWTFLLILELILIYTLWRLFSAFYLDKTPYRAEVMDGRALSNSIK